MNLSALISWNILSSLNAVISSNAMRGIEFMTDHMAYNPTYT